MLFFEFTPARLELPNTLRRVRPRSVHALAMAAQRNYSSVRADFARTARCLRRQKARRDPTVPTPRNSALRGTDLGGQSKPHPVPNQILPGKVTPKTAPRCVCRGATNRLW
jgi:hypothetical protein